jgi:hypothetical protein
LKSKFIRISILIIFEEISFNLKDLIIVQKEEYFSKNCPGFELENNNFTFEEIEDEWNFRNQIIDEVLKIDWVVKFFNLDKILG